MSAGTSRHYKVDEVLPRHFIQTAAAAGVSTGSANGWMAEIREEIPDALERVGKAVGVAIPGEMFEAIARGALQRASLLA